NSRMITTSRAPKLLATVITTGVLSLLPAAAAQAVTNTLSAAATATVTAMPSPSAPAALQYEWTQRLDTDPSGQQPETTADITVLLADAIRSNAQYFPSCAQNQVDGQL